MRIVVSGGGTAGHISPILAVLDELHRLDKDLEVLFIGSGGAMEHKILAGAGVEYVRIPAGKFRRYGRKFFEAAIDAPTNWKNFKDFFKFNSGVFRAYQIVRKYKPDVVFVKGSYVGLPVGLAAHLLQIPCAALRFYSFPADKCPKSCLRFYPKASGRHCRLHNLE